MKLRNRIAAALVATACLFGASPASAEWVEASSTHFLIYGDMPEGQARSFAERLERYAAALRFFTHARDTPGESSNRVTVFVVDDVSEVQRVLGAPSGSQIGGFYTASAAGSIAVTPRVLRNSMMSAEDVLFHEYAHHILMSSSDTFYPGWVAEGMAEFFSTAQLDGAGNIVIGAPNTARIYSVMQQQHRLSARDLLASDTERLPMQEMEQVYSRGWLLIHYLLLSGERQNQFDDYLRRFAAGAPSLEAGQQAFGSLSRLDLDLDSYRNRRSLASLRLTADRVPTGPVAIRALRPGEAQLMPTRLRSALGVDAAGAASLVPTGRRVAAAYPQDAWVQRALAEIEYDAGNLAEAEAAADRALAIDPNLVGALVYKGKVHARLAQASGHAGADVWREARSWFLRANRVDPDYALPLVLYFDSFLLAGETPTANAANGLFRAIELVPQDREVHMRVGRELLRQGDVTAARRAIAPVAFDPHAGDDNPARSILQMIDGGGNAQAALAAADEAGWNRIGDEAYQQEEARKAREAAGRGGKS